MTAVESELYSVESYQLAIPGMDGYRADKLALTFSGAVDLAQGDGHRDEEGL